MQESLLKLDAPSRRRFMEQAAAGLLGVSVLPTAASLAAQSNSQSGRTAKHVIYLFMSGAMSQLDTFDPKPKSEFQGETKAIATKVPGIQVSEHMPELAKLMKGLALIRGLSTETGAHQPGRYLMRTSYKEIPTTRHPGMGAWVQKVAGKINKELPGNVVIGNATRHPGAGFLEAVHSPVPIGNPATGLQNTKQPSYLQESQFDRRMRLSSQFDRTFRNKHDQKAVLAYSQLYSEARKLMDSQDLKAFDLSAEKEETKEKYGTGRLGQACLLARRLVEEGVRYVEVESGGWDNHREIFTTIPDIAKQLDQAVSALLLDLVERGLYYDTIVVVATEFGRTPKINQNVGRDHHPGAFSALLAGGGIRGGQVYGTTDENAQYVEDEAVTPQDLNATIAKAIGLPYEQEFSSPAGRPFKIAHDGEPIDRLFG